MEFILYTLIGLGISAGIVLTPLKRWGRYLETIFHELGHAFIGVLLGKKLKGFKLYADTSGATITMSNGYGIRGMLTHLAGYPAPIVFSTVMLTLSFMGHSKSIMFGLIFIASFMFLFVRNIFAVIPLMLVLAIGLGSLYLKNDAFTVVSTSALAGVLIFLGVESLKKLYLYRPQGSDATMLTEYVGLNERFWIVLMMILTLVNAILFPVLVNFAVEQISNISLPF
jgi:hypothetical protein